VGAADLIVAVLAWLATVSFILAVFNMLPGAPLDGGRVLAAVLWRRSGDERRARQRATEWGRVIGEVMIGLGVLDLLVGSGVGGSGSSSSAGSSLPPPAPRRSTSRRGARLPVSSCATS
jgi:Zn-dependent protease